MISVWVAVITAACSLAGTIITVLVANRQTLAALDKKSELSDEKIQGEIKVIKTEIKTLSDRVEQHNNLIDRTYKLEAAVTELQHNAQRG